MVLGSGQPIVTESQGRIIIQYADIDEELKELVYRLLFCLVTGVFVCLRICACVNVCVCV